MNSQLTDAEVASFEMFLKIIVATIIGVKSKGLNLESLPPLCGVFSIVDNKPSLLGFDCLYDDEEYSSFSVKQSDEIESWVIRARHKFTQKCDLIGFCYTMLASNEKDKNLVLTIASIITSQDKCFSVVFPVTDNLFSQEEVLKDYTIIEGSSIGVVPYYGSFFDTPH